MYRAHGCPGILLQECGSHGYPASVAGMHTSMTSEGLPVWIGLARWCVLPGFVGVATLLFTRLFERLLVPRAPAVVPAWPENAEAFRHVSGALGFGLVVPLAQLVIVLEDQLLVGGATFPRGLLALTLLVALFVLTNERRRLLARHGGLSRSLRATLRQSLLYVCVASWNRWLVLAFLLLPRAGDPWPWAWCLLGCGLYASFAGGLGLWIGARLGWVRASGERLRASVARVATRAGVDVPRAHELEFDFPNGFLQPVSGELGVTRRALELLSDDELDGLVAHELGHGRERRALVLAYLPVHAACLGIVCARTLLPGGPGWWVTVGCCALLILARFLLPRFQRAAELRADAFARAHADPAAFARMLETLHREGLVPPRPGQAASHPALAERVAPHEAATPERAPLRPRRSVSGAVILILASACAFGVRDATRQPADTLPVPRLTLALRGPEPFSIAGLARTEERAGDDEAALRLYHGGAALEPANPWWPMEEARLLARLGRCDAARARFAEAERRCRAASDYDCETWLAESRAELSGCP